MTDPRPRAEALDRFLGTALKLAREARTIVLQRIAAGFDSRRKQDGSFVTDVDLEVETRLRAGLQEAYPDHSILGEEQAPRETGSDYLWTIDPIDGTHSLRHGVPLFGTLLALTYRGQAVVGVIDLPGLDRCYGARFGGGACRDGRPLRLRDVAGGDTVEGEIVAIGQRAQFVAAGRPDVFDCLSRAHPAVRTYCDCFGHALAVEGAVGAMVDFDLRPWDITASRLLIAEAGGKYVEVGKRVAEHGIEHHDVVFGKPTVVDWIVARIGGS